MPHQRLPHYLDEALNAAIALPCEQLPSEVARVLVNLCGAVRHLDRENRRLAVALGCLQERGPLVFDSLENGEAALLEQEAA
jgi:hypothetical protein